MKKEDILKLSKEENRGGDEREKQIHDKAYALSASIGMAICMIVSIIETTLGRSETPFWMIYTGMYFPLSLIEYLNLKTKKWLILTIIFGFCFVCFVIKYIFEIIIGAK